MNQSVQCVMNIEHEISRLIQEKNRYVEKYAKEYNYNRFLEIKSEMDKMQRLQDIYVRDYMNWNGDDIVD